MLKKCLCFALAFVMIVLPMPQIAAAQAEDDGPRIEAVRGDVTVQRVGGHSLTAVYRGMNVYDGDVIITGLNSTATVSYYGQMIIMGELTKLSVNSIWQRHGRNDSSITLVEGMIKVRVDIQLDDSSRNIVQAAGTIIGVRGTKYILTYRRMLFGDGDAGTVNPFVRMLVIDGAVIVDLPDPDDDENMATFLMTPQGMQRVTEDIQGRQELDEIEEIPEEFIIPLVSLDLTILEAIRDDTQIMDQNPDLFSLIEEAIVQRAIEDELRLQLLQERPLPQIISASEADEVLPNLLPPLPTPEATAPPTTAPPLPTTEIPAPPTTMPLLPAATEVPALPTAAPPAITPPPTPPTVAPPLPTPPEADALPTAVPPLPTAPDVPAPPTITPPPLPPTTAPPVPPTTAPPVPPTTAPPAPPTTLAPPTTSPPTPPTTAPPVPPTTLAPPTTAPQTQPPTQPPPTTAPQTEPTQPPPPPPPPTTTPPTTAPPTTTPPTTVPPTTAPPTQPTQPPPPPPPPTTTTPPTTTPPTTTPPTTAPTTTPPTTTPPTTVPPTTAPPTTVPPTTAPPTPPSVATAVITGGQSHTFPVGGGSHIVNFALTGTNLNLLYATGSTALRNWFIAQISPALPGWLTVANNAVTRNGTGTELNVTFTASANTVATTRSFSTTFMAPNLPTTDRTLDLDQPAAAYTITTALIPVVGERTHTFAADGVGSHTVNFTLSGTNLHLLPATGSTALRDWFIARISPALPVWLTVANTAVTRNAAGTALAVVFTASPNTGAARSSGPTIFDAPNSAADRTFNFSQLAGLPSELTMTITNTGGRTLIPINSADLVYGTSLTFTVAVSGFAGAASSAGVRLTVGAVTGLSFAGHDVEGVHGDVSGIHTRTFTITVTYDGTTAFSTSSATISIDLDSGTLGSYVFNSGPQTTTVNIRDGQGTGARAIPITADNIAAFNTALTSGPDATALRMRHYVLRDNISLSSNWTPIPSFSGTFNGDGHTISNLTTSGAARQGMFREILSGGEVRNLGLLNVSISGASEAGGGIAGVNEGLITNSFVIGGTISGAGSFSNIGGIVGVSSETVTFCYADVILDGTGAFFGGIAGQSSGILSNSVVVTSTVINGASPGPNNGRIAGSSGAANAPNVNFAHFVVDTAGGITEDSAQDGTLITAGNMPMVQSILDSVFAGVSPPPTLPSMP